MFIINDLSFRRLPSGSDRTKSLLIHPKPQENQMRCPLQTSNNRAFAGFDHKGEIGTIIDPIRAKVRILEFIHFRGVNEVRKQG